MITATTLLKTALERKSAFLLEGAGIGALGGGAPGYHLSKDDEVDALLAKEKKKHPAKG